MNQIRFVIFIAIFGSVSIYALPVKEKADENEEIKKGAEGEDWELSLEYGRYLKEVVQALESDPEFRKKLETANVEDIKSGKISRELHFVDHNVRSKLDELKRRELERLRHLAMQEHEKKSGVDRTKLKIPVHVDHKNPTRFEPEDLKKLILQLNKDLEEVEKNRKTEFKQYELQKEYEYKHKIEELPEEQKIEIVKKHEEEMTKHKEHPKLHHPGSKQQFEEVWEEQDHMKSEDFDPRTFFHVHDLDGNGYWDENEVKALFQKELDKMYDPNAPEDDLIERYEEMERMREHVFGETDTNKDNLISFDEFLQQTKKSDFERDEGWQGLDEQELFSQQEYQEFERQRQHELQQLVESGAIPPPPGYHGANPPQRLHMGDSHQAMGNAPYPQQGVQPGYQGDAQGYHDSQQGYQGQLPQGYQGQAGPQGHAAPQGYQGQAAPQGYLGQAAPQGYQGQATSQGYPGQAVPQGYQGQGVPQGYQGQGVPQGYQGQGVPQGYQGQGVPQGYQGQGVPQGYQGQGVPQGYQGQGVPQGYQGQAVSQGYQGQAVPQGYQGQAVPQGYQGQVVPQGFLAVPHDQGMSQPQVMAQPHIGANPQAAAIQPLNIPQQPPIQKSVSIPPVPQPQALPNAQPQPIPQAQLVNQGQNIPPQIQHGTAKKPDAAVGVGSPPGGVVLQNPQEDLNRQPELKPVDNHLPGSN